MTTQFDATAAEAASRAHSTQPPALYGEDERIAALVRRARFMIRGAAQRAAAEPSNVIMATG